MDATDSRLGKQNRQHHQNGSRYLDRTHPLIRRQNRLRHRRCRRKSRAETRTGSQRSQELLRQHRHRRRSRMVQTPSRSTDRRRGNRQHARQPRLQRRQLVQKPRPKLGRPYQGPRHGSGRRHRSRCGSHRRHAGGHRQAGVGRVCHVGAGGRRRRHPVQGRFRHCAEVRGRSVQDGRRRRERLYEPGHELRGLVGQFAWRGHRQGRRDGQSGHHRHVGQRQQDGHRHPDHPTDVSVACSRQLRDAGQPQARLRRHQDGNAAAHRRREQAAGRDEGRQRPFHRFVRRRDRGHQPSAEEPRHQRHDRQGGGDHHRGVRELDEGRMAELARRTGQRERRHGRSQPAARRLHRHCVEEHPAPREGHRPERRQSHPEPVLGSGDAPA